MSAEFKANGRSWGEVLAEIADGLKQVTRSEFDLAKAEGRLAGERFKRTMILAVSFGALALLGILPLLAAAVIGLGEALDGNYWLSSLIVGSVLLVVGGIVAYVSLKRFNSKALGLPQTRESLQESKQHLQDKVEEITDVAKRRVS
jgi:uncharacterized membrane protein YqjE